MSAPSSALLVTGGEAVMRRTFADHRRAYWSAEFALILEKHGWLDFETAGPEALDNAESLSGRDVVIVAWLPEDVWRPAYVASLRAFDGIVLLEGPFPPLVEELLSVERCGSPAAGARGPLHFAGDARSYIERRFGERFPIGHRSGPDPSIILAASGDPQPLELVPRQSVTRRPGLDRAAFFEVAADPFEENVGRAALSIALAYRARFARTERFYEDPVTDAQALLACVRCFAALSAGPFAEAFRRLIRDAAGSNRPPVALAGERTALARAIWAVALAEASAALDDMTFAERAREVVSDARREWSSAPDPALARWRVLLALELGELAAASGASAASALLDALLPTSHAPRHAIGPWLDAALAARLGSQLPASVTASQDWIEEIGAALRASGGASLPRQLEGFTLPDLMLVLGSLKRTQQHPAARRVWRMLVELLYDRQQGLFLNGKVVEGKLVPSERFASTPIVALGLLDAADPIELVNAPRRALEGYSAEQLTAWTAAPYTLQPYRAVGEQEVLATLTLVGQALPAIWRRGNVIATSFQLLAQIVHMHTVEPLDEPFASFRSGDTIVLEYTLLALISTALAERPPRSVQVGPWPWGVRYGLTVRHDVDRILDEQQFSRLFEFECRHRLGVTWFWLPDRLEPEQLKLLDREPGHEVALHAVRLDRKSKEMLLVGRSVSSPIAGEAIHGAGDGWLGHLTVRAAVQAGLLYTELAPPVSDCPYARYPWVDADGRVGSERIIGISYNTRIEGKLGTKPGSEGGPKLYRQLLNHPDLNFDRLEGWVQALPDEPRVDWTCEQLARWWQATHVSGRLMIVHIDSEPGTVRFELSASAAIEDLELRIPCQPEDAMAVTIDGDQAEWGELDEPEHPGIRVRVSLGAHAAREVAIRFRGPADRRDVSKVVGAASPSPCAPGNRNPR